MFVLHEMPVLTRDAIRAASPPRRRPTLPHGLTDFKPGRSDRADQDHAADHVGRRDFENLVGAAVAISADGGLQSLGRPDRKRALRPPDFAGACAQHRGRALPAPRDRSASIASDRSRADRADQPILAGYNLVIDGRRLRGATTRVLIDGQRNHAQRRRHHRHADHRRPAGRRCSRDCIRCRWCIRLISRPASPSEPHRGVESNVAAFVLAPQITTPAPMPRHATARLPWRSRRPSAARNASRFWPAERPFRSRARPATTRPTTDLDFPIPDDFPTGANHLLRVQIDGAESPLEADANGRLRRTPIVTIT